MSSTTVDLPRPHSAESKTETRRRSAHGALAPIGRVLFALIFVFGGLHHFSHSAVAYATAQHVPWPAFLVPFAGVIAIAGGLSVLLGYRAKLGAWLLVLFLVPVTLMMHDFWSVKDAMMAEVQQVMFMKNVAMLGAALLIAYFGAGPISFDALKERRDRS